jgi:DNA-directed RNA polymerase subunit RPC12/RpoP
MSTNYEKNSPEYWLKVIACFTINGGIISLVFRLTKRCLTPGYIELLPLSDSIFFGLIFGFSIGLIWFGKYAPKSVKEAFKNSGQQERTNNLSQMGVKCPTCSSKNVERISTGKKVAYVAATGLLALAFKKVRSQFECKSCGYKW